MRKRRRLFPILFGFLLFAAAVALAVVLRKHAPPEPARLLPGAGGPGGLPQAPEEALAPAVAARSHDADAERHAFVSSNATVATRDGVVSVVAGAPEPMVPG